MGREAARSAPVGVRPSERAPRAPRGPAPSGLTVGLEPAEDSHGRFRAAGTRGFALLFYVRS